MGFPVSGCQHFVSVMIKFFRRILEIVSVWYSFEFFIIWILWRSLSSSMICRFTFTQYTVYTLVYIPVLFCMFHCSFYYLLWYRSQRCPNCRNLNPLRFPSSEIHEKFDVGRRRDWAFKAGLRNSLLFFCFAEVPLKFWRLSDPGGLFWVCILMLRNNKAPLYRDLLWDEL